MFPEKISTCVRCEKLKIQEKHTEPTTLELRRAAKRKMFRAFPKHTAGWSLDRMVTDGNHQPGQSQTPQHSTGWHPKREREDIYWMGREGKGKHRRAAKHREPKNPLFLRTWPGEQVFDSAEVDKAWAAA